jgi:AraC-like DNA-binding protein
MKTSPYTIQYSTVESNLEGLLKLLQKDNKQYLVAEILDNLIEYHPDEQDRVPLCDVTQNIHTIAKITNDPCLGAKIIDLVNLDNIPLYKTLKHCTQILNQSGNSLPVNVLVTLIARYFSVISEVVTVDIQYHKHLISIEVIANQPEQISYHQIEGAITGLFRIILSLSHAQVHSIEFTHALPSNSGTTYQDLFDLTPKHNGEKDKLVLSSSHTVGTLDENSLLTLNSIQSLLDNTFPELNDRNRCQHILRSILSFGEPTRENVASIMSISVSTLQRKLRAQQTSFKELLLETRQKLAHELLIIHQRNASDTAFLLGYQSSSQFFKAFKKWFSVTPIEYKNQNKK